MASAYYKVTAYVGTPHRNAVEVTIPLVGPAGPAGPAGTGLETLTDPGDTLYQGASTGQRLPIGTSGQVLKVVGGFPAWGNESGAVEQYTITSGTTFTVPDVRAARVLVDRNNNNDLAINLNTTNPQNLDRVEVILVRQLSGRKTTVVIGGSFGDFDLFGTQKATFVYSENTGPARWVKAFDNVFQDAEPEAINAVGQPGSIAFADNFLYICIGINQWRRVAVSTWTAIP
jgi:hypothetical protein